MSSLEIAIDFFMAFEALYFLMSANLPEEIYVHKKGHHTYIVRNRTCYMLAIEFSLRQIQFAQRIRKSGIFVHSIMDLI